MPAHHACIVFARWCGSWGVVLWFVVAGVACLVALLFTPAAVFPTPQFTCPAFARTTLLVCLALLSQG